MHQLVLCRPREIVGELLIERLLERIQLLLRLCKANPRTQTRDHLVVVAVITGVLRTEPKWLPDVYGRCPSRRILALVGHRCRHDADYRKALSVNVDDAVQNASILIEDSRPQTVAQQHSLRARGQVFLGSKIASQNRL